MMTTSNDCCADNSADEMFKSQGLRGRHTSDASTAVPLDDDHISIGDHSDDGWFDQSGEPKQRLLVLPVFIVLLPLVTAIALTRLYLPGVVAVVVWSIGLITSAAAGLLPGRFLKAVATLLLLPGLYLAFAVFVTTSMPTLS
eukprot:TRINITY_DN5940_c1_g1_i1.p1 TRINITY_DN5940_c1_g1~~TRINITY_DN5940_c1_g1_i1.p1  ORF type:complete len:142 (-),score=31.33 TRINITY_DN5940_c1_g1_i1:98-523(-)